MNSFGSSKMPGISCLAFYDGIAVKEDVVYTIANIYWS
jgi:hypothetical protein